MQDPLGATRFIVRVWNTAMFWTWMFNGLRFASGVLLLPLLWRMLPESELDMYSLFIVLSGFAYSLDAMFSATISRYVGYALRGVTELQAQGVSTVEVEDARVNTTLLGELLGTSRSLYASLSLALFVLLGIFGTLMLFPIFAATPSPNVTRAAWAVTLVASCLELYTGYLLVFLRGLNKVVLSARLSTAVYGTKLLVSVLLLLAGLGLLAVPVAALLTAVGQRWLARKFTLANLPNGVMETRHNYRNHLRSIWPNTWRLGAILLSINLVMSAFGKISTLQWGLGQFYPYYFSFQIIYGICTNMAGVWTHVKWPIVCQLRATGDSQGVQKLVWPRLWLQLLTFGVLALAAITIGPPVLKWVSPEKELLPRFWLSLMALYALLEMHYIFWATVISTENRVPSFWAVLATNLATVMVAYALVKLTGLGLGSFIVAPLACGLALNYWLWPKLGARSIGITWWRFMVAWPAKT